MGIFKLIITVFMSILMILSTFLCFFYHIDNIDDFNEKNVDKLFTINLYFFYLYM